MSRKIYTCLRCGSTFSKEDLEITPGVRCPYCGFKIILKLRTKSAKRLTNIR